MDRFDLDAGAGVGSLVMVGVAVASLIGAAVFRLRWTLRQRRRARSILDRVSSLAPSRLEPGPTELAGTVEAQGNEVPISVHIVQHGVRAETGEKNDPYIWRWLEQGRTVVARPFSLVLHGSGARVRVESDERVLFHARARVTTVTRSDDTGERTWEAQLRPGERVAVAGSLMVNGLSPVNESEGYRGAPGQHACVLRADEGEPLRVIAESAAAEEDRVLARRRRRRDLASVLLMLVCVGTVSVFGWELHRSRTVIGEISSLRYCKSDRGRSEYLCFDAVYPAALEGSNPDAGRCSALRWDTDVKPPERLLGGDRVLLSFVPEDVGRCNVGARLTASVWELVILLLVPGVVVGVILLEVLGPGGNGLWFDRKPLNDEERG